MKATFLKIIATLEIWFFQLLNKIEGMFKSIAGIQNITESNSDGSSDLFEYLFSNQSVRGIFWAVVGISVLIAAILNSTKMCGDFGTKAYCATVGDSFYGDEVYNEKRVKENNDTQGDVRTDLGDK